MNPRTLRIAMLAAFALPAGGALAGPLAPPPGPVAPTHRTLTQVEPRTPVGPATTPGDNDASPSVYKITEPGSYYLTGDVLGESGKHGIEIAAPNVTLDLTGFRLEGVAGSLSGVYVSGNHAAIVVRNGHVTGFGQHGINATYVLGQRGGIIEEVAAVGNGQTGIRAASGSIIRACTAADNGQGGIGMSVGGAVEGCVARGNASYGIFVDEAATVVNCSAVGNQGTGILGYTGCTIVNCAAKYNEGDGIRVSYHGTVVACASATNQGDGFEVNQGTSISGCTAANNASGAGVRVLGSGNRIERNHAGGNTTGFMVTGTANFIAGNTASANTGAPYSYAAGNTYGPTVSAPGQIASSNPWANFSY